MRPLSFFLRPRLTPYRLQMAAHPTRAWILVPSKGRLLFAFLLRFAVNDLLRRG